MCKRTIVIGRDEDSSSSKSTGTESSDCSISFVTSQELVLSQVHTLDDVATIVEHAPDVLGVDRASEMRITVMSWIAGRAYSLEEKQASDRAIVGRQRAAELERD